jgi:hypothetical protein
LPTAGAFVAVWCVVVCCLLGLANWLLPAPALSLAQLAPGLVLFVPFSRLAGAPLALDWNRHR